MSQSYGGIGIAGLVDMRSLSNSFIGVSLIVLLFPGLTFCSLQPEPLKQRQNRATAAPVSPVSLSPIGSSEQSFLGYDSGPAVYFPQSAVAGSKWAVRFSPPQSCSLVALSVYSAGGRGAVQLHIFSDSSGLPGRDLTVPFEAELAGDLTNQVIYLPSSVNVGGADFHVAFELLSGGAPYITGDGDGGSGHSSYAPPGGGWNGMDVSDFALRAFVRYYGTDKLPPQLSHISPDAAFADEGLLLSARISDFSGIAEAAVHYSIDGGGWASIPMEAKGDLFEARLPSLSAGGDVRYYIEAKDGAVSPNTSRFPAGGVQAPFELPVYAGRQIKYDDGSAENFFVADYQYDDNRFAVRLTPEVYPAQILALRLFVNDTAKLFLSVWSADNGLPGRLLSGPWKVGLSSGEKGWIHYELPAGSRPAIEKGDFFLVAQWSPASPEKPGIGADGSLPDGRSFFYSGAGGWKNWVYNDWMLRASYMEPTASTPLPFRFSLEQNFPNPFNPSTEIRYRLEQPARVELAVYNVLGQKIKTLASGNLPGGEQVAFWDGRDELGRTLSSGIYFYRLRADGRILTRRMVLIK